MPKIIEKEFDLVKVLEDSVKKMEYDIIAVNAKIETLKEVAEYIKANKLKVTKAEETVEPEVK